MVFGFKAAFSMSILCFHHNSGFLTLALVIQVHKKECIVAWWQKFLVLILFSSRLSRRFAMNYFYNCTIFPNTKNNKGTAGSAYSHSKLVLLNWLSSNDCQQYLSNICATPTHKRLPAPTYVSSRLLN